MTFAQELFGETLRTPSGATVNTSEALANKDAIGIYFSAHWCPPCRGFTPQLAKTYKELVNNKHKSFEIVFVSSDKDETAFNEYHGEMPWLALPFSDRERKGKLSGKFKVQGIPTFVILDGKTGKTISADGRSAVSNDPDGEKFPWIPPTFFESLGEKLTSHSGEVDAKSVFADNDAVGLYFSAHWCPPCRGFTPKLVESYKKIKAANKKFEVIFVSSDRDESSFKEYFGEMPWLALPFEDRERKGTLSELFGVEGIPTFVILDKNGKVINTNGRGAVSSDPEGQEFPWHPKPVSSLDSPDGINETASVILFAEKASTETKEELSAALEAIAKPIIDKAKAAEEDASLIFFVAKSESGVSGRVRQLTQIGEALSTPQVVLLDIPDNGGYYHLEGDVTAESIAKFVSDYQSGALAGSRKQLS